MMKKTSVALIILISVAFFSCKESDQDKQGKTTPQTEQIETENDGTPDGAHNSQNSLDWEGTYKGVLPCADCPGIETELSIDYDLNYDLKMDYLERDSDFHQKGKLEWSEDGQKITLKPSDGDGEMRFFVGENILFQLDENGDRIEGENEENYQLHKVME